MNAYEARLLGVERQLMMIGRRAQALERETWAGLQDALQLWGEVPPSAVPCSGSIDVTVTYAGNPVAGATVTLTGAGTGSGTTDGSGFVSIAITVAGSYTVTMSAIGCLASTSTTLTATCSTNTVTLTPSTPSPPSQITFSVKGCHVLAVDGATATATKGGVTVTGTTNSAGSVTLDVSAGGPGSYSWSVSYGPGGLVGTSGTVTVGACGSLAASVTTTLTLAASGYQCLDTCGNPLPLVLHATNAYGSFTMTSAGGGAQWIGTQTISGVSTWTAGCAAGGGCNPGAASSGSVLITWRFNTNRTANGFYSWCAGTGANYPIAVGGSTSNCNAASTTMSSVSANCPPTFLYSATATDPHLFFTFGTLTIVP